MKANILVVDDEPSVRGALNLVLDDAGYQVSEVDSAAALQRAAASTVEFYETRIRKGAEGELIAVWAGDVAYEGGDLVAEGGRHRLAMIQGGWLYERISPELPADSPAE